MTFWKRVNRLLYRARCAAVHRRGDRRRVAAQLQQELQREPPATLPVTTGDRAGAVLYVSCGRIGDAVLARPFVALLAARTGAPLVIAGRPETKAVLEDLAVEFVPLDLTAAADASPGQKDPLRRLAARAPYRAVVADVYAFHGQLDAVSGLVEAIPASRKFVYEGYAPPPDLAPIRRWPRHATLVPSLAKGAGIAFDPDRVHVLRDHAHYLAAVLAALDCRADVPLASLRPELPRPSAATLLERLRLPAAGFVACQPFSQSRKRDWPLARWRALWARYPEQRFVLLGAAADRGRAEVGSGTGTGTGTGTDTGTGTNVIDRCGETSVREAAALLGVAKAFVGLDSGLTHVAAALGTPTVCVAQNSNLGYFVPYPSWLRATHLRVVHHAAFEACAGCFMACSHEPLFRTFREGALCLRTLDAGAVATALDEVLAAVAAPVPDRERAPAAAQPPLATAAREALGAHPRNG